METYQPAKTAILLVDPFNDFLSEGGKLWDFTKDTVQGIGLVKNLKALLSAARANHILVVYVPHHHTEKNSYNNWKFLSPSQAGSKNSMAFEKNSWGAEFHPDLVMKEGDLLAQNHWTASGFANTDLDLLLNMNGIDHIVIAGMRANTCIDSTARFGVELGYHVTLIKDGIGSFTWDEIKATVEINFPNYGHELLSTEEFINKINQ